MKTNQSIQPPVIVDFEDTGALGVLYLKQFWSRAIAGRIGALRGDLTARELCAQNVLLAGLRLGIRETMGFLMNEAPSFDEFEAWVLAKNEGIMEPARIERLNGALRGDGSFTLEGLQASPVLSASDLAFWDEHGYVVVKQVVTADQCLAAVQAIFEFAGIDIDRPDSWYTAELWVPLAHHPALWANRVSPRIRSAFAQLWGRSDLWMNVDVCGVNPPVRPGCAFRGSPLHWDMTLTPPVRFGTQAMLYLTDTASHQGAFSCVPGFHRKLENWLRGLPRCADPRARARDELHAVPIPGDAGDLIIWHHALPHAATPNHAELPRVVQYLNMFPSQYELNPVWT
jgi:ectoine hydroxylase-related dioxygenase (phytanoyl-CoA dioxygenase family)